MIPPSTPLAIAHPRFASSSVIPYVAVRQHPVAGGGGGGGTHPLAIGHPIFASRCGAPCPVSESYLVEWPKRRPVPPEGGGRPARGEPHRLSLQASLLTSHGTPTRRRATHRSTSLPRRAGQPALARPSRLRPRHPSPFSLVREDWRWWLRKFCGHVPSIVWPKVWATWIYLHATYSFISSARSWRSASKVTLSSRASFPVNE